MRQARVSTGSPEKHTENSCPLCCGKSGSVIEVISFADIYGSLTELWGIELSAEVAARHTPRDKTEVIACSTCDLHYFSPAIPGDPEFYEQLSLGDGIYLEDRWEFDIAASSIHTGDHVLDLGAGSGAFLMKIKGLAGRVVGLDHNQRAIDMMKAQGIEAFDTKFNDFASANTGRFDAVCAFQIVEHLHDVSELLIPAIECLNDGGRLLISVPNRNRYKSEGLEPLDCPPHHMSRWSGKQLEELAARSGAILRSIQYEPPDHSAANQIYLARGRRLSPLQGDRVGELVARAYRKSLMGPWGYKRALRKGTFARRGIFGHTMLAEFVMT